MRNLVCVVAALSGALLCASCKARDPKSPEAWLEKLSDQDARVRVQAVQQLRKLGAKQAAGPIAALLKDAAVKEDAALALSTLGGPDSVQPLLDAIDTTVGAGSDAATRTANRTNAKICDALAFIGYPNAGPALLRLARSRDDLVRIAAVQALGAVKFREAVPELSHLVDDELVPPILIKKAIVSLGQIGDPAALPALLRGLVIERQGVSFIGEASFALFQLGDASVGPLLAVAQDQDAAYLAWAKEHSRAPAGTYAKAALVLGDLGDARAVPVLLKLLKYTDPDPIPSTSRLLSQVVRQFAADALGRLRAREAAAPILALVSTRSSEDEEPDLFYANALCWIGERPQAAQLLRLSQAGAVKPRLAVAQAAVMFGEPAALQKELAQLVAREGKRRGKECAGDLSELTAAQVTEEKGACEAVAARFASLAAPLAAAGECAQAEACWAGKLASPDALVRARAAYELGRAHAAAQVPALLKLAGDAELQPRLAAIRALEWLIPETSAQPQLKAGAAALAAQLTAEQGRVQYLKVNEELRRLQARLARL